MSHHDIRKAAEKGISQGLAELGIQYSLGQGVPQNYEEAYFWLDVALAGKLSSRWQHLAAKIRDDAASHLTKNELTQTQERAEKWFAAHPPTGGTFS